MRAGAALCGGRGRDGRAESGCSQLCSVPSEGVHGGDQIGILQCTLETYGLPLLPSFCWHLLPSSQLVSVEYDAGNCSTLASSACVSSEYFWLVGGWEACSSACGGAGSSRREVRCVTALADAASAAGSFTYMVSLGLYVVEDGYCGGVAFAASLSEERSCNSLACSLAAWEAGPWGSCSSVCGGGTRVRSVSCVGEDGLPFVAGPGDAGCGPVEPVSEDSCSSEPCTPADFCLGQPEPVCSGHGGCNRALGVCLCGGGWQGTLCQIPPQCSPGDRVDGAGQCCVSVVDVDGFCCGEGMVSEGALRMPLLDREGHCCVPPSSLDAQGICGGAASVVDVLYRPCAPPGVLDAGGVCCASGSLDFCGSDLASLALLPAELLAVISFLDPYTLAYGMPSPPPSSPPSPGTSGPSQVVVVVNLTISQPGSGSGGVDMLEVLRLLERAASTGAESSTSSILTILSAVPVSLCGNGVCELGELCSSAQEPWQALPVSRSVFCLSSQGAFVADDFCTGPRPDSVQACAQALPCAEDVAVTAAAESGCSQLCSVPSEGVHGGDQIGILQCTLETYGLPLLPSFCWHLLPSSQLVSVEYDAGNCSTLASSACVSSEYFWLVGGWEACSSACGGAGSSRREVRCVTALADAASAAGSFTYMVGLGLYVVEDGYCGGVAFAASLSEERSCNSLACSLAAWEAGPWGSCSSVCGGGTRVRSVSCVGEDGLPFVAGPGDAGCGPVEPVSEDSCSSEPCTPADFCLGQPEPVCSGHGGCNARWCCVSVVDVDGFCCGEGMVSEGALRMPLLDREGHCCVPPSSLDAQGICGGAASVVDVLYRPCAPPGVLDAGGVCCASGSLDFCGVCDGVHSSCGASVLLELRLPAPGEGEPPLASMQELVYGGQGPGSAAALLASALQSDLASLALLPAELLAVISFLDPYTLAYGMPSPPPSSPPSPGTSGPSQVVVVVNLTISQPGSGSGGVDMLEVLRLLERAASTGAESSTSSILTILSAVPVSLCGNGVCELGELCSSAQEPWQALPVSRSVFCLSSQGAFVADDFCTGPRPDSVQACAQALPCAEDVAVTAAAESGCSQLCSVPW
eukprot:jgi/Mesvir1/4019/Mv08154-RA.1